MTTNLDKAISAFSALSDVEREEYTRRISSADTLGLQAFGRELQSQAAREQAFNSLMASADRTLRELGVPVVDGRVDSFKLTARMREHNWSIERRVRTRDLLASAGYCPK